MTLFCNSVSRKVILAESLMYKGVGFFFFFSDTIKPAKNILVIYQVIKPQSFITVLLEHCFPGSSRVYYLQYNTPPFNNPHCFDSIALYF